MAWLLTPGCRLDELAPDPGSGRVRRDVDVHQFAPAMGNEHEHVQGLEGQGRYREQVGSPDVMSMVPQERTPGLARRTCRPAPAIASNGTIADHDAQLEQLASDPFGTPRPVLARQGPNELLHLRTEMRATASGAGLPAPEQAPTLSVPPHHRVRRDDPQMLAPAGTAAASQHPQQLVPA